MTDYTSVANRDIFVYEHGSYTQRYVYGINGDRLWAEFDYAEETKRGEPGENLASDFASADIQKIYYRRNLTESTLFAVDENDEVINHVMYDDWGKPLTDLPLNQNYAGIDNINNYAGYTYDEVLELYFVQNRFYNANTRQFTQEDPIKDGANWYAYCEGNPLVYVDWYGLAARRNASTRYVNVDDWLNVREGPGTTNRIIAKLQDNTAVIFTGDRKEVGKDTWARIIYNNGQNGQYEPITGWVASKYLRESKKSSTNPAQTVVNGTQNGLGYQKTLTQAVASDGAHFFLDKKTQEGTLPEICPELGFFRDENGIYHTDPDAIQQHFGYNDLYDAVFNLASSMDAGKYQFPMNDQEFMFWARKGDYLNLGAGAELGLYTKTITPGDLTVGYAAEWVVSKIPGQWSVDRRYELPMTMSLSLNGETIATYKPTEPQWWITSFNPSYQEIYVCHLTATFTVDFSDNTDMYEAFTKEWRDPKNTPWTFNDTKHTATLVF